MEIRQREAPSGLFFLFATSGGSSIPLLNRSRSRIARYSLTFARSASAQPVLFSEAPFCLAALYDILKLN
jgi:hypothetical protein